MNVNVAFVCFFALFTSTQGQSRDSRLFFIENCPSRPCPVDCELRSNPGGCPGCQCPEGQRCPVIECPVDNQQNANCRIGQKMNGCQTCVCDSIVHSIYDQNTNVERFIIGTSVPGARETCRMRDANAIDVCLKPLREFHQNFQRKNPTLQHSMYPWLYFELSQFGELCELMQRLPLCTGRRRLDRCKEQQPELTEMYTIYNLPCNEQQNSFFDHFNCLHNIMVSHFALRFCERRLELQIRKAQRGRGFTFAEKRRIKCRALNQFMACTKYTMQLHCGEVAQGLFRDSMVRAASVTAPECTVEYGSFKAVRTEPVNFKFQGKNNESLRPSSQKTYGPKPWRPTFVQLLDGKDTVRNFTAPASVKRQEKIQNLRTRKPVFRHKDMPIALVAYKDANGVFHMRGRCEKVPPRNICPDGSTIQIVIRWQRERGSDKCTSYKYDYCGMQQEDLDLPVKYEEQCYNLCFTKEERNSMKHIQNMQFRNGFRVLKNETS